MPRYVYSRQFTACRHCKEISTTSRWQRTYV